MVWLRRRGAGFPLFVVVVAAFAVPAVPVAASPGPAELGFYLAEYELSLDGHPSSAEISSASGRLVLKFTGSACAGYTNDARIVTALETADGDRLLTDVRTHTVETPDGQMDFANESYAGGEQVENVVGTSVREEDGLDIALAEPVADDVFLEGPLVYPTEHVAHVLAAARARQPFVALDLYDGSSDGRLVYHSATVIGAMRHGAADDEGEGALVDAAGFGDLGFWPITISYFEKQDARADATPDFVMSMMIYENGVGRSFHIDYGDFALVGKLSSLEMLPPEACDSAADKAE